MPDGTNRRNFLSRSVINNSISEFRNNHPDHDQYENGECFTFAYALAMAVQHIGVTPRMGVIMRDEILCPDEVSICTALSHCVVVIDAETYDIQGHNAYDRWTQNFSNDEDDNPHIRNVFEMNQLALRRIDEIEHLCKSYEAGFDKGRAEYICSFLITSYFKNLFSTNSDSHRSTISFNSATLIH
jgi:hypothetical protein